METTQQKYKRYLENPEQMEAEAQADVAIDLDDVLPDMVKQASVFLTWAQIASIAESQSEALKQHHEALSAECREKAYAKLVAGGDKATEQRIKDVAIRDPAIQTHASIRNKADLFSDKLKRITQALQQKKDMLIQIGFRQRAELGYYPKDPDLRTSQDIDLAELKKRALDSIEQ